METAMLAVVELWPHASPVMGPRCVDNVWAGDRDASGEKERIEVRFQTWIMASDEPERKKLDVGSTAMDVTGWRWDVEVDIKRPEHICTKIRIGGLVL
jgi:hypothetical protein